MTEQIVTEALVSGLSADVDMITDDDITLIEPLIQLAADKKPDLFAIKKLELFLNELNTKELR